MGTATPEELTAKMERYVEITFDCLPLRSVGRRDIPLDASPKFRAQCERILQALDTHGAFNTYYLYNAACVFHLTNDPAEGMLEFGFEGTVFTDSQDAKSERCDLKVELVRETCDWLSEPIVQWFQETTVKAVIVEFDRYIAAGDLRQAIERIERIEAESDKHGGFMGMYL